MQTGFPPEGRDLTGYGTASYLPTALCGRPPDGHWLKSHPDLRNRDQYTCRE